MAAHGGQKYRTCGFKAGPKAGRQAPSKTRRKTQAPGTEKISGHPAVLDRRVNQMQLTELGAPITELKTQINNTWRRL
jgi:hypothetical protein